MTDHKEDFILTHAEEGISYVILHRPESLNAFNLELADQFLRTMDILKTNESVRAVVIKGAGKIFSAGGDIKEMLSDVERGEDRVAYFHAPLAAFNKMVLSIREIPKPVLAAVHGAVAGVAFNLMLACDLRIASEGTRFTQAFSRIGLSPDGGGTYLLPRFVGYARACELALLPTEIDCTTAINWGLINWVVPANVFDDEVQKIAVKLSQGPTLALARAKALLNSAYDRCLANQMEAERLAQIENAGGQDFEEGLKSFVEKRQPKFHGR